MPIHVVDESFELIYGDSPLLQETMKQWIEFCDEVGLRAMDVEKYILKDMITRIHERYQNLVEGTFYPSLN